MAEIVCNTSPLQYLHQCGQLSLLQSLAGRILVPEGVREELLQGISSGINLPDIDRLAWIEVRAVTAPPGLILPANLGSGESQVLQLGMQMQSPILILDDAHARRAARVLGLPIRGTLGVLLDAKQAGLIAAIRPIIDQMQLFGFRLSASTKEAVLTLAGETIP